MMICEKCSTGFNLSQTAGTCEPNQQTIECPEGYYSYFDKAANAWSCKYCPKGCQSCFLKTNADTNVESVVCTQCVDTFYYYLNDLTGACLSMNCSVGQIFTKDKGCVQCPLNCETCIFNLNNSIQCVQCFNTNPNVTYAIVDGRCQV